MGEEGLVEEEGGGVALEGGGEALEGGGEAVVDLRVVGVEDEEGGEGGGEVAVGEEG